MDKWGELGSGNGEMNKPDGMALKEKNGVVYVHIIDSNKHRVQKFDFQGAFITGIGVHA